MFVCIHKFKPINLSKSNFFKLLLLKFEEIWYEIFTFFISFIFYNLAGVYLVELKYDYCLVVLYIFNLN